MFIIYILISITSSSLVTERSSVCSMSEFVNYDLSGQKIKHS